MKQYLASAVVFALVVVAVAVAQDPPPTDPTQPGRAKAIQVQPKAPPAQPGGRDLMDGVARARATKVATLEEDFETLEAHREVRKAVVKAAEVAVRGAEANLDLVGKANVAQADVMKAKLEVEAAKAQLDIRVAEMKEVEVKIKHAKKRLDDAKAGGVRPPPGVRPVDPKQVDPPPPADQAGLGLKKELLKLEVEADGNKETVARAAAELRAAKAELAAIRAQFDPKFADRPVIVAAVERVETAKVSLDKAITEQVTNERELAKVKAKLKEIEK